MSTIDTEHRDAPICPHCGHEHTNAPQWEFGYPLENRLDTSCEACGADIHVTKHTTITYSTEPA
jgi:predicted RNA-binding Zn-ribbon protein involved in translation (DUF1610 family)